MPPNLRPNSAGMLDGMGRATTVLNVAPGQAAPIIGSPTDWAFVTINPIDLASNAVSIVVVP